MSILLCCLLLLLAASFGHGCLRQAMTRGLAKLVRHKSLECDTQRVLWHWRHGLWAQGPLIRMLKCF